MNRAEKSSYEQENTSPEVTNFTELNEGRPHHVARTEINLKLEEIAYTEAGIHVVRTDVPDNGVSWSVDLPAYQPQYVDFPRGATCFAKPGETYDPWDPAEIDHFSSIETNDVQRDEHGYPLNPVGRTGIQGRGMLDKWGETEASDLVVTTTDPETGDIYAVLIRRHDNGKIATPGGKCDEGETPFKTAVREFFEETNAQGIEIDESQAELVYKGYIDDSRNTDNAWMASSIYRYEIPFESAQSLTFEAGDDADQAALTKLTLQTLAKMHANMSHILGRMLVDKQ